MTDRTDSADVATFANELAELYSELERDDRRHAEDAAAFIDQRAGAGTTAAAIAASSRLIEVLDALTALAESPEGQAVARFWRASEAHDADFATISDVGGPFTAPVYLIVERLAELAPHAACGDPLTAHGRAMVLAAVDRVRASE
jgi:hypothetical protein